MKRGEEGSKEGGERDIDFARDEIVVPRMKKAKKNQGLSDGVVTNRKGVLGSNNKNIPHMLIKFYYPNKSSYNIVKAFLPLPLFI